jgi:erythromycin esterase-like protein
MTFTTFLSHAVGIGMLAIAPAYAAHDDNLSLLMQKAAPARLVLVGEMHGTREVPALVGQLARGWAAPGAVVVALEYPQSESAALQAYVDSDGGAAARKRLLASPFWNRRLQDGRSSDAMLALIDSVRLQIRGGQAVRLAAFDMTEAQSAAGVNRDKAMADNLRAVVQANAGARVIALAGNYHVRQKDGAPWDAAFRFMAGYLTDLSPYSLRVDAARGSYWGCSSPQPADCKAVAFGRDADPGSPLGLYADGDVTASGYDQALMLAQFTASLPAARTN